jgi:hypothetical protein
MRHFCLPPAQELLQILHVRPRRQLEDHAVGLRSRGAAQPGEGRTQQEGILSPELPVCGGATRFQKRGEITVRISNSSVSQTTQKVYWNHGDSMFRRQWFKQCSKSSKCRPGALNLPPWNSILRKASSGASRDALGLHVGLVLEHNGELLLLEGELPCSVQIVAPVVHRQAPSQRSAPIHLNQALHYCPVDATGVLVGSNDALQEHENVSQREHYYDTVAEQSRSGGRHCSAFTRQICAVHTTWSRDRQPVCSWLLRVGDDQTRPFAAQHRCNSCRSTTTLYAAAEAVWAVQHLETVSVTSHSAVLTKIVKS